MSEIITTRPVHGAEPVLPPPVPPPGPEREFTVEARTQTSMVVRRFLHHRLAMASLVVLALIVVVSLVGGRLWKYDYASTNTADANQGPSWDHPMGTDELGKDELAAVLRGTQKSVQIMFLVALFSTTFGVIVGAMAGYFRGWLDAVVSRLVDLWLTVPILAVLAVLSNKARDSGNWFGIAVLIAAFSWMTVTRVVRAEFLSLREKEFVEAARAMGARHRRIIVRHVLPNTIGSIIVAATLTMATAILLETALSYLGLGIRVPDTSLGLLVSEGQTASQTRPWLFYFPGLVIIVIVLCINFVGDGLRDAFDAKATRVRR